MVEFNGAWSVSRWRRQASERAIDLRSEEDGWPAGDPEARSWEYAEATSEAMRRFEQVLPVLPVSRRWATGAQEVARTQTRVAVADAQTVVDLLADPHSGVARDVHQLLDRLAVQAERAGRVVDAADLLADRRVAGGSLDNLTSGALMIVRMDDPPLGLSDTLISMLAMAIEVAPPGLVRRSMG